jgi:putative restriction endonuclease
MRDERVSAWLLLAFGDDRQYGGNVGYEENPTEMYRYDSFVPNHRQVVAGDAVVLRERERMVGVARIAEVRSTPATKRLRKCPTCGTTGIKHRVTRSPTFRCNSGHEFDEAKEEVASCVEYQADFGDSFVLAAGAISLDKLRAACPRYTDQLSIQRLDLSTVIEELRTRVPRAAAVVDFIPSLSDRDAEDEASQPAFVPNESDRRAWVTRDIRARRGQTAFRNGLIERYGPRCMISNCGLLGIVEAAHISPYRGEEDNHLDNGVLLRSDLHTLFDLNLLGINPDTLQVAFHPDSERHGYDEYTGRMLMTGDRRPGRAALLSRWIEFQMRLSRSIK